MRGRTPCHGDHSAVADDAATVNAAADGGPLGRRRHHARTRPPPTPSTASAARHHQRDRCRHAPPTLELWLGCGARPPSSRRCPSRRTTSGTVSEETNAPYGIAKKALLVGAAPTARVRARHDLPFPTNLYGPATTSTSDLTRDSRADPQDGRLAQRGRPLGRWNTDTRVPLCGDCVEGLRLRPSTTTVPSP